MNNATLSKTSSQLDKSAAQFYADAGVFNLSQPVPHHLDLYIEQSESAMSKVRHMVESDEITLEQGLKFQALLQKIGLRIINHPIISNNRYLARFGEGKLTQAQARHEAQQFSVFAIQFNAAQAQLVANSQTEEEWLERTKILANEMGAPYSHGFDGDLKGTWNIKYNHHTWLLDMCKDLGLEFSDIGKLWVANAGSKAFLDAIFKHYTHSDPNISSGATFGIENWAANNLWKPWLSGMNAYNSQQAEGNKVSLSYIKYHDIEERHHSQATITELLANFIEPWFDAEKFLDSAEKILTEGVQAYYEGQLATLPDKDSSWPEKAC